MAVATAARAVGVLRRLSASCVRLHVLAAVTRAPPYSDPGGGYGDRLRRRRFDIVDRDPGENLQCVTSISSLSYAAGSLVLPNQGTSLRQKAVEI